MTRSPRPVLVHLSPLAAVGGCEINCLRIIEELRHYDHRVLVFDGPGPMSGRWEAAGARVEHLATWMLGLNVFRQTLARWSESQPAPEGIFYWSVSRLPHVLETLQTWKVRWAVHLGNPVRDGWLHAMRRWVQERRHETRNSVTLVACSERVAASYRRAAYFRGYRSCEVIYNAVPSIFDQARNHRMLARGTAVRVGMVARLEAIKDHLTLVRALAEIVPMRPDVTLEFAGDGPLRRALEQEAARAGVAERVRFLGVVRVEALLNEWDVYAHSTTDAEGMGTALAEAMMAGLPCVVTDISVMREVCGNAGAVYVQPGDVAGWAHAILALVADRDRRAQLGATAQARARRLFGAPQCAESYLRLLSAQPVESAS